MKNLDTVQPSEFLDHFLALMILNWWYIKNTWHILTDYCVDLLGDFEEMLVWIQKF